MGKQCKKCGYERKESDSNPDYECPSCGVVYAKFEASLKNKIKENNKEPQIDNETIELEIKNGHFPKLKIEDISPGNSEEISSEKNVAQILGVIGSIILFIGVFSPIMSLPIVGNINYFDNGKGDGTIILVFSVISLIMGILKKHKLLLATGFASLSLLLFTFTHFQFAISEMKEYLFLGDTGIGENPFTGVSLGNNPFSGFSQAAAESVQIQWGWALLIIGSGLIITSALKTAKNNNKAVIIICCFFPIPSILTVSVIPSPYKYQKKYQEYRYLNYNSEEFKKYRTDAVKWVKKSAEQGDVNAQVGLAHLYDDGKRVTEDKVQAVYWYRKAAEQGNADAQWILGVRYIRGIGIDKDEKEAIIWLKKSAQQGHIEAQNQLDLLSNKTK